MVPVAGVLLVRPDRPVRTHTDTHTHTHLSEHVPHARTSPEYMPARGRICVLYVYVCVCARARARVLWGEVRNPPCSLTCWPLACRARRLPSTAVLACVVVESRVWVKRETCVDTHTHTHAQFGRILLTQALSG